VSTLIGEVPGCAWSRLAHAIFDHVEPAETLLRLVLRIAAGHWYKGDAAAPALA
jgi:hypothetical protein